MPSLAEGKTETFPFSLCLEPDMDELSGRAKTTKDVFGPNYLRALRRW